MRLFSSVAVFLVLISGCGGTAQSNSTRPGSTGALSSPAPRMIISPLPDDVGLILKCNKCTFVEEKSLRYLTGEIHNDAKQAATGYVLDVDLQDAKGQSVKKIPGLMLMDAMTLQPGETKKFKERVLSDEANVAQAVVFFKKAGRDVKLSSPQTLKLQH
jgi:hypothetical protein